MENPVMADKKISQWGGGRKWPKAHRKRENFGSVEKEKVNYRRKVNILRRIEIRSETDQGKTNHEPL